MHLIIDGFGGDTQKMQDLEFIYELLDQYPARIGMQKIMPPYVFKYVGLKPEDWGISGFVLIAESHISIHTFPERSYVNIDIFSCKEFDAAIATQDLKERLGLAQVKSRLLERGLEYPFPIEAASDVMRRERLQLSAQEVSS